MNIVTSMTSMTTPRALGRARAFTSYRGLFLRVTLIGLVMAGTDASHPAAAATWTLGHGDIGVAYDPDSPTEFEMEVHVDDGVVDGVVVNQAYEPGDITINVPRSANLKRISNPTGFWLGTSDGYNFTTAAYNALGVPVGSNLWVLSPDGADADHYGTPFLGWATEEGFEGESFGPITFTPTSFAFTPTWPAPTGTVSMAIYDGATPLWVLEDGDTDFTGDSFSVPAGGHVHRTLFFTQPGIYEVGIQAAGLNGSTSVSGSAIYTFQVVPEPSALVLAALGCLAAGCVSLRRRQASRLRQTEQPEALPHASLAAA